MPEGRFVVMYSGNHTHANPLSTLLAAVQQLQQEEPRLLMMSVGGGAAKQEVEDLVAAGARNIVSLPYQPLQQLRHSLSAADVHVVAMCNDMVGIVHPRKRACSQAQSLTDPVWCALKPRATISSPLRARVAPRVLRLNTMPRGACCGALFVGSTPGWFFRPHSAGD